MICEHCNEPMTKVGYDKHHGVAVFTCACCVQLPAEVAVVSSYDEARARVYLLNGRDGIKHA